MTPDPFFYRSRDKIQSETSRCGTIAEAARQNGCSVTTAQKWWSKHGLPKRDNGPVPRERLPKAAGSPVSREEMLEQEVRELRSRLQRSRRMDITNEMLAATLEHLVAEIEPRYAPEEIEATGVGTTHKFMLDWSDLHAAEVVSGEEMNGINAYDWDIMLARHDRMLQAIASFKDKRPYPVDELVINGLGDMLSGNNHAELKETNQKVIMEAALQLGLDMSQWVAALGEIFPTVRVAGVVGNHPRTTIKPAMKRRYDNYDWMVYHIMKLQLARHENVTVDVPKAAQHPVEIFGERHLLFHGDGIRTTMPGVPWGGVMRRVAELANQYARVGLPVQRFHVGHFHNPNIVEGGRIFMNGSVKGPDEYSLMQFGGGHDPSQLLQVYHPVRGLTETCVLDLRT